MAPGDVIVTMDAGYVYPGGGANLVRKLMQEDLRELPVMNEEPKKVLCLDYMGLEIGYYLPPRGFYIGMESTILKRNIGVRKSISRTKSSTSP